MGPLLKPVCLIDTQSLVKYVNTGLTILLILILGVLVLAFLRGLLRGWKYGTYRLVFFAIMLTVVLVTLGAQANALGGMDLSGFNLPSLNFTFQVDGTERAISVKWTTLQGSLEDLILQVAEAFGAKASYSGMLSYASVLASSLIKLLLIFVWGIFLSTFGLLLILLLWHIAFKRFTPRDRRKIKKLRLVSAFEELLIGAACAGMLLSPFTSIVNSLNGNFKVEEEQAKQNETVSMISDILGVYDQSAFAKTFFSWNSMDGSTTFDQQLISFLTQSEVKEVKTDLLSEISAIADLSSKVINAGLLSAKGSEGIKWYLLLSCSSIPDILYALSETTLIQCALPFAVTLATNFEAVKNALGEETCEYLSSDEVDWTKAIQSMSRIYENILDSGIIDCVKKDVESATPEFQWTQLQYVFSGKDANGDERDAKKAMHAISEEISDSALFSHLMAGLLSQLGKGELEKEERADISILDFLPLEEDGESIDYDALVNLDYAKEFNLLYDTIYSINERSSQVLSDVLALLEEPPSTEDEKNEKYRNLLAETAIHVSDYVDLVVGERDDGGEPKENSADCLLDSTFVGNALPSLIPFLEKTCSSVMDMELELSETKEGLKELKDYKREFGAALDAIASFAPDEDSSGYKFIKDGTGMVYDPEGNLLFIEPDLIAALQTSLKQMDKSKIMSEAMPQIAEKYFEDFEQTLSEYGIEQLDFYNSGNDPDYGFGNELSKLLDLVSYSGDLILALGRIGDSSTHLMATMLLEEKDSLIRILDVFAGSKILNPEIEGKKNVNIASLLNHVFSSAGLEDFKMEADALDGVVLTSERLPDGTISVEHENALIVSAITSVPLSDLLSLGSASSAEMLKTLSKIDVETLFEKIGKSEVMRSVAGGAMDKYFTSMLEAEEGSGVTFTNLTTEEDWKNEGAIIQKIVNLATNGIDISEFDINGVSPALVKGLFVNLASSNIFNKKLEDGSVDYRFPEFFSSKVLGMLDDTSISYFADKGVTDLTGSADLAERKEKCSKFRESCLALNTAEGWTKEGGEIDLFSKVLSGVQALGGFSSLSSFSKDNLLLLRDLLENLASSEVFGQVLIGNALTQSLDNLSSSLSSSSFDLSLTNPEIFFDLDKAERKEQVGYLCDVMDTLYDENYGLLGENGEFQDEKMSIDKLNVDYCLRPLLEEISSSKVFSTPREGKEETLLNSFFKTILVESNLYGEGLDKTSEISPEHASGITISSIVDGIADMDEEIASFCDAVKTVQDSGLLSGSSLSLSSLDSSDLDSVTTLLGTINSSNLLYRALPIQIDKAIKNISGLPSSFQESLSLCDPFAMATESDYAPYEDSEITCLAAMLTTVSDFSSLGEASFSELAKLDLSKTLSPLYASRVFNSKVAETGDKEGLTSAQAFVTDILAEMGLEDDLVCSASSPKDSKFGTTTPKAKYRYLVSSTLGIGDKGNYEKYTFENQKSNAFYEVLGQGEGGLSKLLSNLSEHSLIDLLENGGIDFKSLTKSSSTLSSLLKDLSRCALLKDVPINALAKYLSGNELSVDGVDLSLTNFYYPYFYDAKHSTAEENWDRGYDEGEIDLLVDLLDLIESNKDALEKNSIAALDPYSLRQLLWELDDSLLFNATGVNIYSANYNRGWESGTYVVSDDSKVTSDLTVFQQMIYLVYKSAGLAARSFDAYHDFSYFKDASYDESLAIELKLHGELKNPGLTATMWREEISAITTDDEGKTGLIKITQDSGLLDEDGKVDTSTDFLKKLSPGKTMLLMRSIGRSRVCGDALATTISAFLTSNESGSEGLGVESFSSYTVSLGRESGFVSNSAFLSQGVRYENLTFSSDDYDGNETFQLWGDVDGSGNYKTELTRYVDSAYDEENHQWKYSVKKIGCDFKFTISKEGSLSYTFDTAKYYLPYGSFEEGKPDSNALEWFLCSLRKSDGTYYSFEGSDSALKEAYDANIPLYGIAAIIMNSSIYTQSYFDKDFLPSSSEDGIFSSGAYSLYEMFSFNDAATSLAVNLFNAVDAPRLFEKYGVASVPSYERYASVQALIEGENDPFAEGKFFESALTGAEASQIAHQLIETAFSSTSGEDAKTAAYRYASSFLTSEDSHYADFLASGKLDYSYEIDNGVDPIYVKEKTSSESVFASHLIAGAINDRIEERLGYAKLSSRTLGSISLTSPSEPTKERLAFLSEGERSLLEGFDAYGYDFESETYDFSNLPSLSQSETKAVGFTALVSTGIAITSNSFSYSSLSDCLLSDEQKEELEGICVNLDGMSGIAKALANLAYTADAYDYFLLKGSAATKAFQDYFFHGEIAQTFLTPAYEATDFPSTYEKGILSGVSTEFSYQNVAKANLYAA